MGYKFNPTCSKQINEWNKEKSLLGTLQCEGFSSVLEFFIKTLENDLNSASSTPYVKAYPFPILRVIKISHPLRFSNFFMIFRVKFSVLQLYLCSKISSPTIHHLKFSRSVSCIAFLTRRWIKRYQPPTFSDHRPARILPEICSGGIHEELWNHQIFLIFFGLFHKICWHIPIRIIKKGLLLRFGGVWILKQRHQFLRFLTLIAMTFWR